MSGRLGAWAMCGWDPPLRAGGGSGPSAQQVPDLQVSGSQFSPERPREQVGAAALDQLDQLQGARAEGAQAVGGVQRAPRLGARARAGFRPRRLLCGWPP